VDRGGPLIRGERHRLFGDEWAERRPQDSRKRPGAERIGEEDINGVPTTHYRGAFPAPEEVFGVKADVSDLHVDVWIDPQDRVRRMQVDLSSALPGVESSASTTEESIDYVSFGRVPKIELPSSDEVFNATGEVESNLQSAAEGN
jgi:hypothetical protein